MAVNLGPSLGRRGNMRQKGAASFEESSAGNGLWLRMSSHFRRSPNLRLVGLAAAILVLLGIVAFGVLRETATTNREPAAAVSRRAAAPQKPAWTRAEEAYIQALWPIHGDVERSTVRLSLGKIFYKTGELGKADLERRVDAALTAYQQAEERLRALQPPTSLAASHDEYLAAVRLFQQSALEVLKLFDDGDDGHLLAAYPLSQEGTDKIREVGVKFWQDEFPPH
jgi:hypothetical protein